MYLAVEKHKEACQALVAVLKMSPMAPLCAHVCCDWGMCIFSINTSKEKGSHSLPAAGHTWNTFQWFGELDEAGLGLWIRRMKQNPAAWELINGLIQCFWSLPLFSYSEKNMTSSFHSLVQWNSDTLVCTSLSYLWEIMSTWQYISSTAL